MNIRRLWIAFAGVILASFAVLGWVGGRIYQEAPPIPERVVTTEGQVLLGPGEITSGQNVWQSLGGMESGSIWGHGSYVAPDWTADWLHREAVFILEAWARDDFGSSYDALPAERQAVLRERLQRMMRTNSYDPATRTLTIPPVRARAFEANLAHYTDVFANGREAYAIPAGTLTDPAKLRTMSGFFFWTSWAAATNRPDDTITYTSNWPHEALIGNRPTGEAVVWTGVSIILLLAGIGGMAFWYAGQDHSPGAAWKEGIVKFAFWSINLGLMGMVILSLLPLGLMQTWGSVEHGYWYARSAEFLQTPVMETLRWLRVPGDTLFAIGAIALAWFVARLTLGPPRRTKTAEAGPEPVGLPVGSKAAG